MEDLRIAVTIIATLVASICIAIFCVSGTVWLVVHLFH